VLLPLRSGGGRQRRPVPVLVKIAPGLADQAIGDLLEVCVDRGIARLIATNTTPSRPGIAPSDR
jgi:dihydroorotate dehydrogenase